MPKEEHLFHIYFILCHDRYVDGLVRRDRRCSISSLHDLWQFITLSIHSPAAALVVSWLPPPCSYSRTVRPRAGPWAPAWWCRGRSTPGRRSSASPRTRGLSWHCDRWRLPRHTDKHLNWELLLVSTLADEPAPHTASHAVRAGMSPLPGGR